MTIPLPPRSVTLDNFIARENSRGRVVDDAGNLLSLFEDVSRTMPSTN